ncbi:basic helix-loop-helix (bHLH) DNA-bindingsuperfamily protein [Striga asiatica]|uniref:Basic helix-loop-helix (BHLH) DNA-bindingsuperfamily protein n=1 Tax=Striga asiatica TaxID=4170 RepID=A0A5A7R4H9_STRAF|nr:basic helix-loop-helix (bHLH) DNA-bindingsuperfamily protein [Striga asiatica]
METEILVEVPVELSEEDERMYHQGQNQAPLIRGWKRLSGKNHLSRHEKAHEGPIQNHKRRYCPDEEEDTRVALLRWSKGFRSAEVEEKQRVSERIMHIGGVGNPNPLLPTLGQVDLIQSHVQARNNLQFQQRIDQLGGGVGGSAPHHDAD